jgi:hypothetical protein
VNGLYLGWWWWWWWWWWWSKSSRNRQIIENTIFNDVLSSNVEWDANTVTYRETGSGRGLLQILMRHLPEGLRWPGYLPKADRTVTIRVTRVNWPCDGDHILGVYAQLAIIPEQPDSAPTSHTRAVNTIVGQKLKQKNWTSTHSGHVRTCTPLELTVM